ILPLSFCFLSFFFQAEDGIRDFHVTGVQTCALPISSVVSGPRTRVALPARPRTSPAVASLSVPQSAVSPAARPPALRAAALRPGQRTAAGRRAALRIRLDGRRSRSRLLL